MHPFLAARGVALVRLVMLSRILTISGVILVASLMPPGNLRAAPPGSLTHRIAVDQFGYLPGMSKIAVVSDPQVGFNAAESYTPGNVLQVRTWNSNIVVFSAAPTPWSNGMTHAQSGDLAWWFDFSAVTNWGEYYIYDPTNDTRSPRFHIDHHAYDDAMKQAVRMYYYQRRGTDKVPPYTDARWSDGTNFLGPLQDSHCRLVTNAIAATEKDLRGGWFDAGDYNKYVNFTGSALSDLLFAFQQNPLIWPDDWGIPESGNGVPDLLDEVKWELDWVLRMQNADGSVLSKMGVNGYQNASPPGAETSQVFYGAASTTASFTAAGNFAQAVRPFLSAGLTNYALTLSNAAVRAYNWALANPNVVYDNTGFLSANPEVDTGNYAYERDSRRTRAAVFLYQITGLATYRTFVETNYPNIDAIVWGWWGPYETPVQDALLYFSTLPGVTASVATAIRNSSQSSINGGYFYGSWTSGSDAYRAPVTDDSYLWGGNSVKGHTGLLYAEQAFYGLNPAKSAGYSSASEGFVHYLHGVNPLTMVYLSNMYGHGAEICANEFYHSWFADGTIYDDALSSPNGPAPGYVPGGANASYAPDPSYTGPPIVPPMNQPPQKSYKDWNTGWPEDSWEVTEPGIYYQASYVFLLSRQMRPMTYADWTTGYGLSGAAADPSSDADGDGMPNLVEYAFSRSPLVSDRTNLLACSFQVFTVGGQPGTYLTVQFPRQLGQTNLIYTLQASSDLTNWTPLCTVTGANSPSGPGYVSETGTAYLRQVLARDVVARETVPVARFIRLLLQLN